MPISTVDGEKVLLVKDVSGYKEHWAGKAEAEEWIASTRPHYRAGILLRDAQLALRLPQDVVVLDVDAYGDKAGARTFAALQGKWGRLEPTWISTARPAPSGGRFYRVPEALVPLVARMRNPVGNLSTGEPYGGLDVLRWCHRYVTVWPSWHGGVKARYNWYYPDGTLSSGEMPVPADLPLLPARWVEGLSTGVQSYLTVGAEALEGKPSDWLRARPGGAGPLCPAMARDLARYTAEVIATGRAGGCYPVVNVAILALVGNATEGHRGGLRAINQLWKTYAKAMQERSEGRRPYSALLHEFTKSLRGAIQGEPASKFCDDDSCEDQA